MSDMLSAASPPSGRTRTGVRERLSSAEHAVLQEAVNQFTRHRSPARPSEIADAIGMKRPQVSAVLSRLAKKGYIRRTGTRRMRLVIPIAESHAAETQAVPIIGGFWPNGVVLRYPAPYNAFICDVFPADARALLALQCLQTLPHLFIRRFDAVVFASEIGVRGGDLLLLSGAEDRFGVALYLGYSKKAFRLTNASSQEFRRALRRADPREVSHAELEDMIGSTQPHPIFTTPGTASAEELAELVQRTGFVGRAVAVVRSLVDLEFPVFFPDSVRFASIGESDDVTLRRSAGG